MSKNNSHLDDSPQRAANQNNQMSDDDPGDGNRTSFTLGKDGTTALERPPEHDQQDQETIEQFGERGAATTDKEA